MKKILYSCIICLACLQVSAQTDSVKPAPADSFKVSAPAIDSAAPPTILSPAKPAVDMGTIKGIVTDEKDGSPMIGVNVSVKIIGSTAPMGTRTDENGGYELKVPVGLSTLTYTYVGYRERTSDIVTVKDGVKVVNIKMTDTSKELDIVVVSGNKIEKKLGEQTQSMEVLKGQNITNSAQTISEAMNKVPGVNMLGKTISIRGGSGFSDATSNRTLVLLDEVPMVSPENGGVKWETMPTEAIEQMEIVKGPATVSNGAQALNALVNVRTITPQKDEPFNKIYVNYGGYIPFNNPVYTWFWKRTASGGKIPPMFGGVSYVHARKYGDVDVVFNGAYQQNQGYTQANKDRLVRAFVKLKYIPHKHQNIAVGANTNFAYHKNDDFFIYKNYNDTITSDQHGPRTPTGDSSILVPFQAYVVKTITFNFNPYLNYYDKSNGRHSLRASYYYVQSFSTSGDSSTSHKLSLEYLYTKKFKKADADIAAGVRYSYKNISGVTFGEKYSHYGAVYAQGEKRFAKKFTIKIGLSLEYNKLDTVTLRNDLTFLNTLAVKDSASRMSSVVKPVVNIGINYQVTEGTFLRGSFGQGYRFPDIAEEFVLTPRAGAVAIPNPDLKPESSWTAEVGIKQGMKFSRWVFYADLAAYISRYTNLIEFTTAPVVPQYIKDKYGFQLYQHAQNTPHAQIWGVEASAIGTGAIFGVPLNFLLGYNYMDPKNLDYNPKNTSTHQYLYYRSRHSAKADIQTTYKGFIVGFTAIYIGRMLQLDQIASLPKINSWVNTHSLKGDFVLDARVGYNWKDRFTATVIAKNMANREYTLRPGFVEAPANITLQVTYHWGKFIPKKKEG